MTKKAAHHLDVYIVDGSRTPFLRARNKPGAFSAADLSVSCGKALLARQPFLPSDLEEVISGCVMPSATEANVARFIALRLGCGKRVPAWTVQRNCASGLQALDSACKDIANGRYDLVLAGGVDAMTRAPVLFNEKFIHWRAAWSEAKSLTGRLKLLPQMQLSYLKPVLSLIQGLTDSLVGLNMGQTAEKLAYRFGITREEMDEFALMSQQRAANATEKGYFSSEITPLYDYQGNCYLHDDGIRTDTSLEKLAKLTARFDGQFGTVTAGNSSQVTDGAAYLLLAGRAAIRKYHLPVIGRIVDVEWAALEPEHMGLGPVHAIAPILGRHELAIKDVDYWEINEAFAAQVLACQRAFADEQYCKEHLGLHRALGPIDKERLNIDGGAIALGHPVGASGARLVLHLLHVLRRQQAQRGVASLCIGGGQGGAVLIENVSEVVA